MGGGKGATLEFWNGNGTCHGESLKWAVSWHRRAVATPSPGFLLCVYVATVSRTWSPWGGAGGDNTVVAAPSYALRGGVLSSRPTDLSVSGRQAVPRGACKGGSSPTVSPDLEAICGEQEVRGACIYWGGLPGGEGSSELLACTEFGAGGGASAAASCTTPGWVPCPVCQPGAARVKF